MTERYMTRHQFAAVKAVSVDTVDRWIRDGMPSELWPVRNRRIKPSDAERWLLKQHMRSAA